MTISQWALDGVWAYVATILSFWNHSGSWWAYHATGVGMHYKQKWKLMHTTVTQIWWLALVQALIFTTVQCARNHISSDVTQTLMLIVYRIFICNVELMLIPLDKFLLSYRAFRNLTSQYWCYTWHTSSSHDNCRDWILEDDWLLSRLAKTEGSLTSLWNNYNAISFLFLWVLYTSCVGLRKAKHQLQVPSEVSRLRIPRVWAYHNLITQIRKKIPPMLDVSNISFTLAIRIVL